MPASSQIARPAIRVAASAPLELMWLIHWSGASHSHPDFPVLEELRQRRGPELRKVWAEHPQYSSEMLVLAHRSGTMFDLDLNRFFSRIDASISDTSPVPSLLSESPAERELTRERLERLRADAAVRKRYVDLLQALWSDVQEDWEGTGRAAVTGEAQKWSGGLEAAPPYRQLLRVQHIWPPRPETDTFADAAEAGGNPAARPARVGRPHLLPLYDPAGDAALVRRPHLRPRVRRAGLRRARHTGRRAVVQAGRHRGFFAHQGAG